MVGLAGHQQGVGRLAHLRGPGRGHHLFALVVVDVEVMDEDKLLVEDVFDDNEVIFALPTPAVRFAFIDPVEPLLFDIPVLFVWE